MSAADVVYQESRGSSSNADAMLLIHLNCGIPHRTVIYHRYVCIVFAILSGPILHRGVHSVCSALMLKEGELVSSVKTHEQLQLCSPEVSVLRYDYHVIYPPNHCR